MALTPHPDVNALIDRILSGVRCILDGKLVGLYTFGSLATGAFDPAISDIDLVAALAADLDDREFDDLERMHADIAQRHPLWNDRIELGYIAVDNLRRIAPDAEIALISPGEPLHRKPAGTDWLFNLSTLRDHGLALVGPPPRTLIDPISSGDLSQALPALMREWREWVTQTELIHQRTYQAHMIVTMCRALYTFKHGAIASKPEAAAWAEQELPQWSPLIRDAMARRAAKGDEHVDHDATLPQTLRFVHSVTATILDE